LKIIVFLKAEEKNLGQFSKNFKTFYPKNCHEALKNMGWDPGSEIREPGSGIRDPRSGIREPGSGIRKNLFRIPDPGVKRAPDPGSATLVLATNFCCSEHFTADKNTMKIMLETLNRSRCTVRYLK
jgi:hypothetical protein